MLWQTRTKSQGNKKAAYVLAQYIQLSVVKRKKRRSDLQAPGVSQMGCCGPPTKANFSAEFGIDAGLLCFG